MKLLKFHAPWCSPCKAIAPQISSFITDLQAEGIQIELVDVDVDDDIELTRKFNIRSVPTVILMKDGVVYYQGQFNRQAIRREIDTLLR